MKKTKIFIILYSLIYTVWFMTGGFFFYHQPNGVWFDFYFVTYEATEKIKELAVSVEKGKEKKELHWDKKVILHSSTSPIF